MTGTSRAGSIFVTLILAAPEKFSPMPATRIPPTADSSLMNSGVIKFLSPLDKRTKVPSKRGLRQPTRQSWAQSSCEE